MNDTPPFKIALVGASCTGKTSLLNEYRNRYKNDLATIAFVEEAAREYFKTHPLPDRFTQDIQREIQLLMQKNEQIAKMQNVNLIICDSSTIDPAVYTRAFGDTQGAETLFAQIQPWVPTYSKFLLLDPADVPFEQDDIRRESAQDRQKIHETFQSLFEEKNIPYELLSGTLAVRVEKLHQIIQQVL